MTASSRRTSQLPVGTRPLSASLDVALRGPRPPGFLYHYTSLQGLLGILSSRTLWASSIFYLNDTTEYLGALAIAEILQDRKAKEQPRDRFYKFLCGKKGFSLVWTLGGPPFVASFSEKPDVLSQWRAYTHGSAGVSVGFQTKNLLARARTQEFRLVKCIYDRQVQQRIVEKLLEREHSDWLRGDSPLHTAILRFSVGLADVATAFKDPSLARSRSGG